MSNTYIGWNDDLERTAAFELASNNLESYGSVNNSIANSRTYLNIEPNISVRPEFGRNDYYRFRPGEEPATQSKAAIFKCMKAYENVGIIKNVIDLMGDFASQGITIHHTNRNIERFYRKWWAKVNGAERSERFLNLFYRSGNVVINKRYGKIYKKMQREWSKADIVPESKKVTPKEIPLKYDFLNPVNLDIKGGYAGSFSGNPIYQMTLSEKLVKSFQEAGNKKYYDELPDSVKAGIANGSRKIDLDPDKISTFFYKKDDWDAWAKPMINAIIDDVVMLEKMKLADMSALDGAISNVRLWTLGSLEHKILPQKGAIDRLRDILASNVGGGPMDLVWGPEINFTESNTQIYKFLGSEKYQPVLNSIYAGLGIPPTLTGLAGQSGGFTNNFISLKTLIERLEYGRDALSSFWNEEFAHIAKAMGFPTLPTIHFEYMILSDEVAEKNLLIQLADRDIISTETLRDKLGVINNIEDSRLRTESKSRKSGKMPKKADPFHSGGNQEHEYIKLALQKGEIGIDSVTDIKPTNPGGIKTGESQPKKVPNNNGRPPFKKDETTRKQKRVLPRSKATTLIWAADAQAKISTLVNPSLLAHYSKSSLRELSKSELSQLEEVKFRILCKIAPLTQINEKLIASVLAGDMKLSSDFSDFKQECLEEFMSVNNRSPNIDELRQINYTVYSFGFEQ